MNTYDATKCAEWRKPQRNIPRSEQSTWGRRHFLLTRTAACFEEKDSRYDTTRMERQAMRKTDKVSKRGRKKIFEALPKPKTFLEHEACCTSVGTRMEWSGQSGCAINSVGKQCSASINGRYKRLLQKFWEAFSLGFAFDEVDRFQKYAVLHQVDFV